MADFQNYLHYLQNYPNKNRAAYYVCCKMCHTKCLSYVKLFHTKYDCAMSS